MVILLFNLLFGHSKLSDGLKITPNKCPPTARLCPSGLAASGLLTSVVFSERSSRSSRSRQFT